MVQRLNAENKTIKILKQKKKFPGQLFLHSCSVKEVSNYDTKLRRHKRLNIDNMKIMLKNFCVTKPILAKFLKNTNWQGEYFKLKSKTNT